METRTHVAAVFISGSDEDACGSRIRILAARNTCRRIFDEPLLDSFLDRISSLDLIPDPTYLFVVYSLWNMD